MPFENWGSVGCWWACDCVNLTFTKVQLLQIVLTLFQGGIWWTSIPGRRRYIYLPYLSRKMFNQLSCNIIIFYLKKSEKSITSWIALLISIENSNSSDFYCMSTAATNIIFYVFWQLENGGIMSFYI